MSKKYIIEHIKDEMLNYLVNPNKPNIIGMEHDYCKTTECSTLVDHYDEYFKRISTVKFENKSDLISTNEEPLKLIRNIDETKIDHNDNDNDNHINYYIQQNNNIGNNIEIILQDSETCIYNNESIDNINTNNNEYVKINNYDENPIEQIELDSACQSIITDLPNDEDDDFIDEINDDDDNDNDNDDDNIDDSITKKSYKKRISNKSMSLISDDPETNKNLKELSILLREENISKTFIPNQIVNYETYQEAVSRNNGKTTKRKSFKNCKYEEGRIRITKEEIQTYNKCKKHILLKDFLKLLIWKKFPTINNVCHFNISSVNIAPRTGYTIYAYCKFLNCNNFRIIIRQASYSLIGIVYKSCLEPLHYKNVPLVEQVRGLKKKLLGSKKLFERTDPLYEWNNQNINGNVFARKKRNQKKPREIEEMEEYDEKFQNDGNEPIQEEPIIQRSDGEIVYSCEVIISD